MGSLAVRSSGYHFASSRCFLFVFALGLTLALFVAPTYGRTWKDQQGNVIDAKFVRYSRGLVFLQRGTKVFSLPLESLSDEDQQHVKSFLKKQGSLGKERETDDSPKNSADSTNLAPGSSVDDDATRSDGRADRPSRPADGSGLTDPATDPTIDRIPGRRPGDAPIPTFTSPPPDPGAAGDRSGAGGAAAAATVDGSAGESSSSAQTKAMERMYKNVPGGVVGRSTQPSMTPKDGRISMLYQGSKTDRKDMSMSGHKSAFPDSSKGPQSGPQRPTSADGLPGGGYGPGSSAGGFPGAPASGFPTGPGVPTPGATLPGTAGGFGPGGADAIGYPGSGTPDVRSGLPGRIPDSDYDGTGPLAARVKRSGETTGKETTDGSPASGSSSAPSSTAGVPGNTTRDSKSEASTQVAMIPSPSSVPYGTAPGSLPPASNPTNNPASSVGREPASDRTAADPKSASRDDAAADSTGHTECSRCGQHAPTSDGLCARCVREREVEEIESRHRSEQRIERLVFIGVAACVSFLAALLGRFMRG